MKGKILIAVAVLAGAFAVSARAATQNDGGCGLGSMLIKDNIAWKQIFAATTNGFVGNQTFGISSGTLGCQSGGLSKSAMAQRNFVAANYRDLSKEMAAGGGQYVASLSSLMGCSDSAAFAKFTQTKYETIVPAADTKPEAMLNNLRSEMGKDSALSTCQNLAI
ncbi:MAG: DUF3015 family protein [Elusimicrobia bacterium]|nr:DUF3015 family protein [Elusimicrobiota bacterium]